MDIILQDEIRNAARILGRMRSEKKAKASRDNGKLGGRGKKRNRDVLPSFNKSKLMEDIDEF